MEIKTLNFKRFKANCPDIDEMYNIIKELEEVLDKGVNNPKLYSIVNELTYLQVEDGSFALLDTFQVESDARVEFCYYPTYLCTAIMLLAYRSFGLPKEAYLEKSLKMCLGRKLKGHGFDDISGQIKALKVFIRSGLPEMLHSDFRYVCPEFTEAIEVIIDGYRSSLENNKTLGPFGEDYRKDFEEIVEAFDLSTVFVYGTLLSGRSNSYLLNYSSFIGEGLLKDYGLYDLGAYPGIKPLEGASVKGELYKVNRKTLKELDSLEGEGFLYKREAVDIMDSKGKPVTALVYVYLKETKAESLIGLLNQPWNLNRRKDYVWYVSYGSNMLCERLLCYIKGGVCSYNGRSYGPCSDASAPLKIKPVALPYNMYYGKESPSWDGMGVCFLDSERPGQALGVAYLITKEQLEELNYFEGRNWYNKRLVLEPIEGYAAITMTNKELCPKREPSSAYKNVLFDGIKENYPELSNKEIARYIESRNRK